MLSETQRQRLKMLLKKLANGEDIEFKQMVYLHKIASEDQSFEASLKRAKRILNNKIHDNNIDKLLNDLDLGSPEPQSDFNPSNEDLGEWFSGAPSWLARS